MRVVVVFGWLVVLSFTGSAGIDIAVCVRCRGLVGEYVDGDGEHRGERCQVGVGGSCSGLGE